MNTSASHRSRGLRPALLALGLVGLAVGAWVIVHRSHSSSGHGHSHGHDAALMLDDGRRWTTDVPLRTGMQRIRTAVDQALAARATGRLTAVEAKALSATVQDSVNYLIANCKLPPKADATLHVLIAELLSGAGQLAENPAAPGGLERMGKALRDYSAYFEHPGWVAFDASKS